MRHSQWFSMTDPSLAIICIGGDILLTHPSTGYVWILLARDMSVLLVLYRPRFQTVISSRSAGREYTQRSTNHIRSGMASIIVFLGKHSLECRTIV